MALKGTNRKRVIGVALIVALSGVALQSINNLRRKAALAAAVRDQECDAITSLVVAGTPPRASGPDGITPLMIVALRGNQDQVLTLIRRGAQVNSKDAAGETPLMYAKDVPITEALLRSGADIDTQHKEGETALMIAVDRGNTAVVGVLLKHGANRNLKDSRGQTALTRARRFRERQIEALLAN